MQVAREINRECQPLKLCAKAEGNRRVSRGECSVEAAKFVEKDVQHLRSPDDRLTEKVAGERALEREVR